MLIQNMSSFFDPATLPLYCLGFLTFVATLLDDWLNPKKTFKKFAWYIQEFIYTIISIALAISVCFAMELSQSVCWVASIVMGLIGSTIIRRIRLRKETIANNVIDSVETKVKSKIEGE